MRALALLLCTVLLLGLSPQISHASLAAPTVVRPSGESSAQNPILEWQAVTGATSYRVQVATGSNFDTLLYNVTTESTRATPPADLPMGALHWRVAAIDSSRATGAFSGATFTKTRLSAPVQAAPTDGADLRFPTDPPTFSWEPVPGAKSYRLEVDDAPDFIGAAVHTTTSTSFTLTEPQTVGPSFHWRVQAISAVTQLNSEFSPTRRYQVTWDARPTLLGPTDTTAASIEDVVLRWSPVEGAASYDVEISSNGDWSNNVVHRRFEVRGTQYSPPDGLDNSSYYWRVRARDAGRPGNVSAWSNEPQFTRGWDDAKRRPVLEAPANGAQVAIPTLTWKPVELAAQYELQVGYDINFSPGTFGTCLTNHTTWTPYARIAPTSGHGEPGACTVAPPGPFALNPGTTYYWRVRGIDPGIDRIDSVSRTRNILGLWSNSSTSDTRSFIYRPDTPRLLSPLEGEAVDAPALRWDQASWHGRYRVTIVRSTGSPITADTYATSFSPLTALRASDGPFSWYVQTLDVNGRLGLVPPSNTWGRFTLRDPSTSSSPSPTAPAAGASVVGMPSMTWTPTQGASFYRVYIGLEGSGIVRTLSGTTRVPYAAYTFPGTSSEHALAPGRYEWHVEAFTSSGAPISTGASRALVIQSFDAPTMRGPANCPLGTSTCTQADTPTLTWDAVPGAGGYIVYVASDADFTNEYRRYWTTFNTLTPRESFLDNQAGQSYYWYVRPCHHGDGSPCGPFNTEQHRRAFAFRKVSIPVTLTSPGADAAVANQPTFAWARYLVTNAAAPQRATQEAAAYRIQVSTNDTFTSVLDEKIVEQTTYTPFGMTYPEGPLHWRVQAIDGSGNPLTWSAPRRLNKVSPAPTISAPGAGATVSGVPALRWNPEVFAGAYDLEVYRNGDLNFSTTNRVVAKQTKMTAYTPETSLGGGDYAWRVRRRDGNGSAGREGREGPWSAGRTFTIRAGEAAPLTPASGARTDGLPLYQWRPVAEAVSYQVEVSRSQDFSTLVEKQQTAMTAWAPLKRLADGTYHWRVRVLDAGNNTLSTSSVITFAVTPDGTSPPTSPVPSEPIAIAPGTSRRIGNSDDSIAAAVMISRAAFADGSASRVAIGRNDVFADSLAGAALAGKDGPILYTTGGPDAPLHPAADAELRRVLGAGRGCGQAQLVALLGGTNAVSAGAEQAIRAAGYCVQRFSGASRVETSVAIAWDVIARSGSRQVLVARSHEWADAATGGAYAAASGTPIVVTLTGDLHPAVAAFLRDMQPSDIVVLGGQAAVAGSVESALGAYGPTRRISGAARDLTAIAIAERLWPAYTPRGVMAVNGYHTNGWAYALASAVPAAREGAVQVYVQPDAASAATEEFLARFGYRFAVAAGPRGLISDGLHQRLIGGITQP